MPVDKFGRMSDTKTNDTGVSLTYINNNYIRSDGTTPVTGSIDMNGNTLYNVPDPVNPQDVATKEYTDKKTHMIVVYSNYCVLLRKGEYQFVFGGNIMLPSDGECGFLMPHSGRIKKIKVKISHDEGIENLRNLNLIPWADMTAPDSIFTFTLIKEEKNLTDFLSYNCFKFNNIITSFVDPSDYEEGSITDERIREINEERKKGITFLDKWGDKLTLIDKDIACSFLHTDRAFTSIDSILNISISEGDILNIRTEKENAAVWGRDISFTNLFTFLIELDPL